MLEYVAKLIEFVRFVDDYVATDMAKVRKLRTVSNCPSEARLWDLSYNIWT